jgi:hypothetical protein
MTIATNGALEARTMTSTTRNRNMWGISCKTLPTI